MAVHGNHKANVLSSCGTLSRWMDERILCLKMASYSYLMKKAGHPLPQATTARKRKMDELEVALRSKKEKGRAKELENLRVELDNMVEKGQLVKTPSGNYSLPG